MYCGFIASFIQKEKSVYRLQRAIHVLTINDDKIRYVHDRDKYVETFLP